MRLLIQLGSTALAASLMAAAGPGYLATVGPPPLRFMAMSNTDVLPTVLPPLLVIEPTPIDTSVEPPAPPPEQPPAGAITNHHGPPVNLIAIETAAPLSHLLQSTNREAATVSPQVWLKFFNGPTNGPSGTALLVPLGFTPPQPTAVPSSKSTYQIVP